MSMGMESWANGLDKWATNETELRRKKNAIIIITITIIVISNSHSNN